MKIRFLFLTLFSVFCFSATAQTDEFQLDIINYLTINGTHAQYSNAYDNMFEVLDAQFKPANVPAKEWEILKSTKEESLTDVLTLLASAYRKQFNENDIKALNDFYSTDTAMLWKQDPYGLTDEQQKLVADFTEGPVGQKVSERQGALTEDISKISEYWSRDLFLDKMNALIAKGYRPQN